MRRQGDPKHTNKQAHASKTLNLLLSRMFQRRLKRNFMSDGISLRPSAFSWWIWKQPFNVRLWIYSIYHSWSSKKSSIVQKILETWVTFKNCQLQDIPLLPLSSSLLFWNVQKQKKYRQNSIKGIPLHLICILQYLKQTTKELIPPQSPHSLFCGMPMFTFWTE